MTRLASAAAWSVSVALLVVVEARPNVGLNPLNLWTIVLCAVAAAMAWRWPSRAVLLTAAVLMFVGAFPAMIGGLGYFYLPSVVMLAASAFASPAGVTKVRA